MAARRLKILFVSAEVAPFAKVGGLADVAGALPKALKEQGHDVRIVMPAYQMILDDPRHTVEEVLPLFAIPAPHGGTTTASLLRTTLPTPNAGDIPVYLVQHERFFTEAVSSQTVYTYAPEPYAFFARAVAEFVPRLSPAWSPDVLHCHDWHTGLLPVYLDTFYAEHPAWAETTRCFTVHNLAYYGDFPAESLEAVGLPPHLFRFDRLEFHGRLCFLKGGMIFSDLMNTVSPNYAAEIQTPEYGCGLDGLLRHLYAQGRLSGILNGIDTDVYDPANDPHIAAPFDADHPAGKVKCKAALQKECGLPKRPRTPVVGLVSRLADQKGFDLIRAIAEPMLELPLQFVLLGTGEPAYEAFFRDLQARHPEQVSVRLDFDAAFAQRVYAGSDLFLMPSRFEPCGLGQLMSLRYGTVPLVRATGGLADTITDVHSGRGAADGKINPRGNGFVFTEYTAEALLTTIQRAVAVYQNAALWTQIQQQGMRQDFSWKSAARQYVKLYRRAREVSDDVAAA